MLRHVVSVKQLCDKELLNDLFATAEKYKTTKSGYPKTLQNKVIASLFFEPSTRTRFSFETAVYRLGGEIISVENGYVASSAVKGESIEDTMRTVSCYADGIIMRHPQNNFASLASGYTSAPFINAGEGAGEHPTQALLDLFTIKNLKGKVDDLKVGLVGDLLYGRTIHSLIYLLSLYSVEIYLISPPALSLPQKYKNHLKTNKIKFHELSDWNEALDKMDVLYMTRVQKERFKSPAEYDKYKDVFILDKKTLPKLGKSTSILHPLPRVNEISTDVDDDPRAQYFNQVQNGLYVRMALLNYLFVDSHSNE
jgi:aspartate carbamoyltransferase catalytic subunit